MENNLQIFESNDFGQLRTIDDNGKVTSGQAVKTIKSKVAKYNKANKTDYKVNYISETDSIVIS